jgi:tRNA A-37 threonylcarbamoyl transferase component Bud32
MAMAVGTRLGRYEIGDLIGAGGMGEVYRARDPALGRDVAVKVLPERMVDDGDRQRRFEREARAAAELEHPNILTVFDVGVDGGVPFIVSELLHGKMLADALRRGPLPRARAIDIGIQIARGVAAAHDKAIVHRDLKPSNVFLCRDGRVKILDFGLAAHVSAETPAGDDTTMTETGAVLGTPAYMSPEQVRGQRVDARADLFALGAILYEMLSGRRPFAGHSSVELGHAILTRDPEPLDDPALDSVVRMCLAKEPAARLRSAEDLALVLANLPAPRPTPAPRRSPRVWVLAIGTLAVIAAAGAAVWPSREGAPAPRYTRITFGHEWSDTVRFGPDGATVIYSSRRQRELARVFASTPGRPEARPLTEPGTSLVDVSARGEMLVRIRDAGGRFVMARAALAGGMPRVVYDDVREADFSPDGGDLAIVRAGGGVSRLEYPVGRVLFATRSTIAWPCVSPHGDRVAFVLLDSPAADELLANTTGTVEVVDKDGTRTTLGRRWTAVAGPRWSPDGREVWVSGRRGAFRAIYALDHMGRERTLLQLPAWLGLQDVAPDGRVLMVRIEDTFGIAARVPGSSAEIDLAWYDQSGHPDLSQDGSLVLFAETGESSQERSEAYVRKTDGSPAIDLGAGSPFALSPDGAWALVGPEEGVERSLTLVPIGAGERRPLPRGSIESYAQAFFFAEGKRLALRAREADHAMRIWIQEVGAGDPRPISEEGIALLMRPSGSGDLVPACRSDRTCALYPVAGGTPRPLRAMGAETDPVQLTPDGQSVVALRPVREGGLLESRDSALWLIDLATGRERLLHELEHCRRASCMARSFRLTPDGQGYAYMYWKGKTEIVLVEGLH